MLSTQMLNDISVLSFSASGRATETKLNPLMIHGCCFYRRSWATSQSLKCSRNTFCIKHSSRTATPLFNPHLPPQGILHPLLTSRTGENARYVRPDRGNVKLQPVSEALSHKEGLKLPPTKYVISTLLYKS